jgi:hypothetical protein
MTATIYRRRTSVFNEYWEEPQQYRRSLSLPRNWTPRMMSRNGSTIPMPPRSLNRYVSCYRFITKLQLTQPRLALSLLHVGRFGIYSSTLGEPLVWYIFDSAGLSVQPFRSQTFLHVFLSVSADFLAITREGHDAVIVHEHDHWALGSGRSCSA